MYLIHKQSKKYSIWRSKSCVFCFKQFPLNIKQKFESPYHFKRWKKIIISSGSSNNFFGRETLTSLVSPGLFEV